MAGTAKIAVSLDADLLRRIERIRSKRGETRSSFVTRALRLLTREEEKAQRVRDYVRAYREHPETPREVAAIRAAAKRSLAAVPWDEE
jgi:metal-responsive CopG/Arc/MetJ family transcriptional regulator